MFILRCSRFCFSQKYLKHIQNLQSQQRYQQIFLTNPANNKIKNYNEIINRQILKNRYLELIHMFHSDKYQNNAKKIQYQQISKIIISAYHYLRKTKFRHQPQQPQDFVQDQISMSIFGKPYRQAKYQMFNSGNEDKKQRFFRELHERYPYNKTNDFQENKYSQKADQNYYKSTQRDFEYPQAPQSKQNIKSSDLLIALLGITGFFFAFYHVTKIGHYEFQPKSDGRDYSSQAIAQIFNKKEAKKQAKKQKMIASLLKDQPPCLEYPLQDPHVLKQLTEYSIAQDIHLYQVLPQCFDQENKQFHIRQGLIKDYLFPITRIKPNTALTLSLEAQRALQNIYVKAKDVINQLEEKGKYEPPQIFIKFHGYIMFQIRQKPISLKNYKNTEYISLFDLYFDYYSPIFLRKDQFCHYLVGKDEPQNFGWVHINHRKIDPVYIKRGQKAAFYVPQRNQQNENLSKKIWFNYYSQYQDRWKQGGNTKERAGI